jgi:hypothetical protein
LPQEWRERAIPSDVITGPVPVISIVKSAAL